MKRCSRCGEEKSLDDFHLNKKASDQRYAYCKDCARERALAWRQANLERARANARSWARNNGERKREYERGYYAEHKEQYVEYSRKHREKNREGYDLKQRRGRLRRDFGMTMDEYNALLAKQGGVCLLCQQPETGTKKKWLCVDHDHVTGVVRGLLCHRCNRTLGMFNDDPEWFARAARYLRKKR